LQASKKAVESIWNKQAKLEEAERLLKEEKLKADELLLQEKLREEEALKRKQGKDIRKMFCSSKPSKGRKKKIQKETDKAEEKTEAGAKTKGKKKLKEGKYSSKQIGEIRIQSQRGRKKKAKNEAEDETSKVSDVDDEDFEQETVGLRRSSRRRRAKRNRKENGDGDEEEIEEKVDESNSDALCPKNEGINIVKMFAQKANEKSKTGKKGTELGENKIGLMQDTNKDKANEIKILECSNSPDHIEKSTSEGTTRKRGRPKKGLDFLKIKLIDNGNAPDNEDDFKEKDVISNDIRSLFAKVQKENNKELTKIEKPVFILDAPSQQEDQSSKRLLDGVESDMEINLEKEASVLDQSTSERDTTVEGLTNDSNKIKSDLVITEEEKHVVPDQNIVDNLPNSEDIKDKLTHKRRQKKGLDFLRIKLKDNNNEEKAAVEEDLKVVSKDIRSMFAAKKKVNNTGVVAAKKDEKTCCDEDNVSRMQVEQDQVGLIGKVSSTGTINMSPNKNTEQGEENPAVFKNNEEKDCDSGNGESAMQTDDVGDKESSPETIVMADEAEQVHASTNETFSTSRTIVEKINQKSDIMNYFKSEKSSPKNDHQSVIKKEAHPLVSPKKEKYTPVKSDACRVSSATESNSTAVELCLIVPKSEPTVFSELDELKNTKIIPCEVKLESLVSIPLEPMHVEEGPGISKTNASSSKRKRSNSLTAKSNKKQKQSVDPPSKGRMSLRKREKTKSPTSGVFGEDGCTKSLLVGHSVIKMDNEVSHKDPQAAEPKPKNLGSDSTGSLTDPATKMGTENSADNTLPVTEPKTKNFDGDSTGKATDTFVGDQDGSGSVRRSLRARKKVNYTENAVITNDEEEIDDPVVAIKAKQRKSLPYHEKPNTVLDESVMIMSETPGNCPTDGKGMTTDVAPPRITNLCFPESPKKTRPVIGKNIFVVFCYFFLCF